MKLRYLHFLSKSNIKGNKNSGAISVLLCILVVSITVVFCFSVTMTGIMNAYNYDYRARAMRLSPALRAITHEDIKLIEQHEHVERVVDVTNVINSHSFNIIDTSDESLDAELIAKGNNVSIDGLYPGEKKTVIKGKTLDEAPNFSCIVPSVFYPFEDASDSDFEDLDYIDGRSLIGETFTVKAGADGFFFSYWNLPTDDGMCSFAEKTLPSPEYTLTVVGTYPCTYSTSGSYMSLFVSAETAKQISEMALEYAGVDLEANNHYLAQWWNEPSIHSYRIIADDVDNMYEIYEFTHNEMGLDTSSEGDLFLDDTTKLMSILFTTAGTFITLAVLFVSAILLVQSSVNSMRERKGIIGLMKAIGYKNYQIFLSLIYEQLYLTLRASFAGAAISAVIVFVANYRFSHGSFKQLQYVIDWKLYFIFLGVAFLIAVIIPLVTQLLLLRKLTEISPKEAMGVH